MVLTSICAERYMVMFKDTASQSDIDHYTQSVSSNGMHLLQTIVTSYIHALYPQVVQFTKYMTRQSG